MKLENIESREVWEQDYSLYLIESTKSGDLEETVAELLIQARVPEYRRSGTKIMYELEIEDNDIFIRVLGKEEQPENTLDVTGFPQSRIYIQFSDKESIQKIKSEKWDRILNLVAGKSYTLNLEYNDVCDKFLLTLN